MKFQTFGWHSKTKIFSTYLQEIWNVIFSPKLKTTIFLIKRDIYSEGCQQLFTNQLPVYRFATLLKKILQKILHRSLFLSTYWDFSEMYSSYQLKVFFWRLDLFCPDFIEFKLIYNSFQNLSVSINWKKCSYKVS